MSCHNTVSKHNCISEAKVTWIDTVCLKRNSPLLNGSRNVEKGKHLDKLSLSQPGVVVTECSCLLKLFVLHCSTVRSPNIGLLNVSFILDTSVYLKVPLFYFRHYVHHFHYNSLLIICTVHYNI